MSNDPTPRWTPELAREQAMRMRENCKQALGFCVPSQQPYANDRCAFCRAADMLDAYADLLAQPSLSRAQVEETFPPLDRTADPR